MKYFKYTQISQETGISWAIAQPYSGPSNPPLPGLQEITTLYNSVYRLGAVDDTATPNPDNHCWELSSSELADELERHIEYHMSRTKQQIYTEEYNLRSSIFNKYHDTASIAGVYKYEQAKQLKADPTAAAPDVRTEATARNVDALVLADRIIANHEDFRTKEAKIAGIRGKLLDRLNSFVFNRENPMASYLDFISTEKIGERQETKLQDGQMVEVTVDVNVGKYHLNFGARYSHLA